MENKEVEKATNRLYKPFCSSIELQELYKKFNRKDYSIDEDVRLIDKCFKQLEKENAELKRQLQAKDKALKKACGILSNVSMVLNVENFRTKEEWKEWTEDECT